MKIKLHSLIHYAVLGLKSRHPRTEFLYARSREEAEQKFKNKYPGYDEIFVTEWERTW